MNDAPAITSSAPVTATEDELYTYNAAFADPDGTGGVWSLVSPAHTCGGSINAAGIFTFTPDGPVPPSSCVIAVRVCDDGGACSSVQSTTVTVTEVNDAPIATDDNLNTTQGTPVQATAAALLANDTDPDGPEISISAVTDAVNGSVDLTAGTITFTPADGFTGTGGFNYTVSDGSLTDSGHVTVTIEQVEYSGY